MRPIHPLVGSRSKRPSIGPQVRRAMLARQIADDDVGLPKDETVILDRWDKAVWIEPAVLRGVYYSERAACVDALVRESHLLTTPEHFLNVDRIAAAPNH